MQGAVARGARKAGLGELTEEAQLPGEPRPGFTHRTRQAGTAAGERVPVPLGGGSPSAHPAPSVSQEIGGLPKPPADGFPHQPTLTACWILQPKVPSQSSWVSHDGSDGEAVTLKPEPSGTWAVPTCVMSLGEQPWGPG